MNTTLNSNLPTANSLKLYTTAVANLNKDLHGSIDPEVGCAMTVWNLINMTVGPVIPETASTTILLKEMASSPHFMRVHIPQAGDIVVFPTGVNVGHTGVIAFYGILSNNSDNGLLQEKWQYIADMVKHYSVGLQLPMEIYRLV